MVDSRIKHILFFAFLLLLAGCARKAAELPTAPLQEEVLPSQISVSAYSYFYFRDFENPYCKGTWESIEFTYETTKFVIEARDALKGINYTPEIVPRPCETKGELAMLHDPKQKVSHKCRIIHYNVSKYIEQEANIELECEMPLGMRILDKDVFASCLEQTECTLTNGIEIKIS